MDQTLINVIILLCVIGLAYCVWKITKYIQRIEKVREERVVINKASQKMFTILMEELREHQSLKKKA